MSSKKRKNKLKGKICLDVGCGENVQPGFIGMDKRPLSGVELVHDAESFPWPVESGSISVILMSHFVEHVKPWLSIDLIDEAWRVLCPVGLLIIATPYGGSFRYNQDPTHCNPWNEATVEYFLPGYPLYEIYKPKPWKLEKRAWLITGDLELAVRKIDGDS